MSQSSDDGLDSFSDSSPNATATLDTDDVAVASEESIPCCEKCSTPLASDLVSVCRRCGWYASLNQFVDVDHEYEAFQEDDPDASELPHPSHLRVWAQILPPWSWVLIVTVVVIVAESVYALYFTDGAMRMYWSVIQLAIGLAVFTGCHLFNFLVAATEDADVGFLDVLIKPFGLWLRALRNLPRRLWMTDSALAGATAVLMSVFVIGSLPYEMLFDWGTKPKKTNLLAAAVKHAHNLPSQGGGSLTDAVGGAPSGSGGANNLEDAVGDLAGQDLPTKGSDGSQDGGAQASSDSSEGDDADEEKAKQGAVPGVRPKLVCVILGYRLDSQHRISTLVLGAMHDGKLAYAGIVTPPADDARLIDLVDDLQRARIAQPSVPLYLKANWVRPEYVCQVNYHEREADGRLIGVEWEKLRGTLTQSIYARPAPMSAQ